ncbi:MAG: arsenate reductase ArsC [Geobacter sp.]|nr:MAG: arsenate reductase ArsC [Geobacter sp.]
MKKTRVLFVCVHNSARSQMAEAFLNDLAGDKFEARSAGLEPGKLNQNVVTVMKEIGIDISRNETKSAFDLYKEGALFDFVITVCDEASAERCPIFPGFTKRLHWGFPDPSSVAGEQNERLDVIRGIRDQIRAQIEQWVTEK